MNNFKTSMQKFLSLLLLLSIGYSSQAQICNLLITDSSVGACSVNGSPFDPSDDTYTVSVNATATDAGASNQFTVSDGTNSFGPFDYGVGGIITLPPDGNTYTLTYVDVDNPSCSAMTTVSQTPCCEVDVTSTITPITSPNSGEVILCINSGLAPYNVSISPSGNESIYEVPGSCGTNIIVAGLVEDNYTITVTDAQGCETVLINQDVTTPNCTGFLLGTVSPSPTSCIGSTDGEMEIELYDEGSASSITVDVGNGIPPVTFTNLSQPLIFPDLPAGSYDVALFDNNGCEVTYLLNPVVVGEPTAVSLAASSTDVTTVGGTDGSISVCAEDANGGYTVTINPPAGNIAADASQCPAGEGFLISDMPAGSYVVTATDANGCADSLIVIVNDPDCPLNIVSSQTTDIDCNGDNTGILDVEVAGGTAPYSISLDGGTNFLAPQATGVFNLTDLTAGSYDVIIQDDSGCSISLVNHIVINENSAIDIAATITHVATNGGTNGSAEVCINGGTAPYAFSISPNPGMMTNPGATSNCEDSYSLTDLPAGIYDLTVTDDLGCIQIVPMEILEPSCPNFTIMDVEVDSVSCYGANDGTMTISLTGGVAPYTYTVSGLQTYTTNDATITIFGLDNGTYTVSATDASGCFAPHIMEVELFEPDALNSTIVVVPPCAGESNGTICLTPEEGTPAYMYNILDEDDNNVVVMNGAAADCGGLFHVANVSAGTYHIELIDANGCTAHRLLQVTEIMVSVSGQLTPTCSAIDVGAIDVSAAGGTPAYTYNWASGETSEDLTDLMPGDYTVTATDSRGCTGESTFTIETADPSLSFNTAATCLEQSAGAVITLVDGGVSDYDLTWTGGGTAGNIMGNTNNVITVSNLDVGNYAVTVTDGRGCTAEGTTAVPEYDMEAQMTVINTCEGQTNGFVGAIPSTGIPDFNYLWSDGSMGGILNNLTPGDYSVTITDLNGCSAIGVGTVEEYEVMATLTPQDVCSGDDSGSITVELENAEGAVSYSWSDGGVTNPLIGIGAGSYSVTATDALGCSATGSTSISEFDSPTAVASDDVTIAVGTSTTISVSATGGSAPYTYQWTPTDGANPTGESNTVSPGQTTTYTVFVTDANGCVVTASVIVTVVPDVRVVMPTAFSPNGDGDNELYEPFVPGDAARIVNFKVFDRWGKLLHDNPTGSGWDGEFSGTKQPVGTYVYVLEYLDLLDNKELLKGHFNLIR